MKSGRLYRLGVFSLFTAGALVTAVACSDDDKPAAQPTNDSGPIGTQDSGAGDANTQDANTPDASKKALVVNIAHAMTDLGNVQFCFEVGGTFPLPDPLPALPGVAPGQGGPLPIQESFLPLLSTVAFTPYVFPVDNETAGAKCADIIAGDAGIAPADVHKLAPIAAGTLNLGNSYLVVFTGCAAGNEGGEAACGAGYNAETGNLRGEILTVDGTAKGSDKFGFQFIHASPQLQAATTEMGDPNVQAQLFEGTTTTNIGAPIGFTAKPTVTPATAVESMTALSSSAQNGVQLVASDGGAFDPPIVVNFDAIGTMTVGDAGAAYFAKGNNYTFVAIGDPTAEQTAAHGFRLIALKTSLPTQ